MKLNHYSRKNTTGPSSYRGCSGCRYSSVRHGGFSLIEVLVSLSIFTVVVTIAVSTLYTLIEANSRTRNSQSIATNLSFTLDSLSREIRTGTDYYCVADNNDPMPVDPDDTSTRDCVNGGAAFSFNEGGRSLTGSTPNDSRRIAYRLHEGRLQRRLGNGDGIPGTNDLSDWSDLTAEDITIERLRFYVEGSTRSDDESPVVTIFLSGLVGDEIVNESTFSIQTTIPQRLLDI